MSNYIPLELLSNILASLPVVDVLRCTSVCKSWYDLISSSSFISLHLELSSPNQESRLLVKYSVPESVGLKEHFKILRDNQTFDEIYELECPIGGDSEVIGSVNGLVCLCHSNMLLKKRTFLLWNPLLKKSFGIQLDLYNTDRFGFGFLPKANDCMIARLSLCYQDTDYSYDYSVQVDIYELSTNSWRNVSIPQVSYFPLNYDPAVFLKGSLHWGVINRCNHDVGNFGRTIVTFDMTNENLGAVSVPNCMDHDYFNVSTFKGSLCLIRTAGNLYYDIWVMNEYGVPDSWTVQFRIDNIGYSLTRPLYFRENGEIILEKRQSMLVKDYLVSYDFTSEEVSNIVKGENNFGFRVTTYMESLVLIKSLNQVL